MDAPTSVPARPTARLLPTTRHWRYDAAHRRPLPRLLIEPARAEDDECPDQPAEGSDGR